MTNDLLLLSHTPAVPGVVLQASPLAVHLHDVHSPTVTHLKGNVTTTCVVVLSCTPNLCVAS
jgi:hypothetical protein